MPITDEYVTTGEAGKVLGLTACTVRKLADTGLIRSWRVPGSKHRRVSMADVRRVVAEGMGETKEGASDVVDASQ